MRYAIGIDLGGTNIAAGIVTEDYKLLEKGSVPTKAQRPWQEVAADMARLAMELVEKAGLSRADCVGIGVGSPGICNGDTGEVVYSNNLYWDDVPLCPTLTRLTGLPCRLSNDANCAALGEVVAGAAKGCKTAVLLTLGTGVGGGVVIDGKIYEGQASAGAELGHCTLISGGVECTCGRRGCIESYASATALIRQASEAAAAHPESLLNKERITAKSVYDAMRAGDDAAKAVVAQYEEYLGEAIVDMVNIFRPEMLLLGGGSHRTGKQGGGWRELEAFAKRHYPRAHIRYRWAAQDCMTLDGVPYIGPYSARTENLYVATGFNKWGMTSAMAAAMLLTDMVQGKRPDDAPVFSPSRNMLRPQLALNALEAAASLLTPTAPRCPHMGCALKWNAQEHSWDCPCHGSRFTQEGGLIENPAMRDLELEG